MIKWGGGELRVERSTCCCFEDAQHVAVPFKISIVMSPGYDTKLKLYRYYGTCISYVPTLRWRDSANFCFNCIFLQPSLERPLQSSSWGSATRPGPASSGPPASRLGPRARRIRTSGWAARRRGSRGPGTSSPRSWTPEPIGKGELQWKTHLTKPNAV